MKTSISVRLVAIATFFCLPVMCMSGGVEAAIITNSDLVGGTPTATLPSDWAITIGGATQLPVSGLYDGNTANDFYVRFAGVPQGPASNVSPTNFISIVAELTTPWTISSLGIAHDFGGSASQEIKDGFVLLYNGATLLQTISFTGLNDNNIADTDSVFSGANYTPVTKIEVRLTSLENSNDVVEVREIVVEGIQIPEQLSISLFALTGFGLLPVRRRRRSCS